ncbi:glycosyltransferase [Microbacterium gilvum]|uniref:Glycosyltransferase n=1 Tax=Microbacterium gilvum TaxID=1336204 RepID=A0ABP9AUN7_9MICO
MTVALRVVLDQLAAPDDDDLAEASRGLARMLVDAAPSGCVVEAIAPAGAPLGVEGLRAEHRVARGRRELQIAWRMGRPRGAEAGLVHSPTLLAPLAKHARPAQTAVTLWGGEAGGLHEALRARAERFADAVIVPSHALAALLSARFGDRVRVIAGAPPEGFGVPSDAHARRRDLGLPGEYLAAAWDDGVDDTLRAAAALRRDVVLLGAPDAAHAHARAADAGLDATRLHVHGALDRGDRAAVLDHAAAFIAGADTAAWPWRVLEALAVGTPVVARDSAVHREVVADGGHVVAVDDLADAVRAVDGERERMGVRAHDRGRAFSWRGAAQQVWQLHAEL